MTRIVLLLDSLEVPAWVYESVLQVTKVPNVRVVLAVINESPKASGTKSPFLYRLYRHLDRKLFIKQPDAFSKKSLSSIPGWDVPVLPAKPIQKQYSDYFTRESLEQISEVKPDVILRFGFRIIRGEILNLAPLGVWSYHHGDPQVYRGGPPAFWEVIQKIPVSGVALLQLSEHLDQGPVLVQSWTQTDPLSVQRNANRLFWLSSPFIARALLKAQIDPTFLKSISPQKSATPLWKPPGNIAAVVGVAQLFGRNVLRKINEFLKPAHWEIGRVKFENWDQLGNSFYHSSEKLAPTKGGVYWADPFPISYKGEEYVMVEEFDRKENKGTIACILPDGTSVSVLEEEWHLSYPFLLEEDGEIYLIPESAEAGKIYRYRAVDFPFKWERIEVLFDQAAFDPTIWKDESGYWLFVNQKAHPAGSPFDELFLYHSTSLQQPAWTPHPQNPVVSDVRRSRPAGRIFREGGKLYRPAQDSGIRYGYGIQLQEIEELTPTSYREKAVHHLAPGKQDAFLGIHTFNKLGEMLYLDFYFRK